MRTIDVSPGHIENHHAAFPIRYVVLLVCWIRRVVME